MVSVFEVFHRISVECVVVIMFRSDSLILTLGLPFGREEGEHGTNGLHTHMYVTETETLAVYGAYLFCLFSGFAYCLIQIKINMCASDTGYSFHRSYLCDSLIICRSVQ